jgi:hypothetical protein
MNEEVDKDSGGIFGYDVATASMYHPSFKLPYYSITSANRGLLTS